MQLEEEVKNSLNDEVVENMFDKTPQAVEAVDAVDAMDVDGLGHSVGS